MSTPSLEIMNVDRVVHEPSGLAIVATLHARKTADFKRLQSVIGMSKSSLSMLAKIEAHGLIAIEKSFVGKTARTDVQLTSGGKTALRNYWRLLQDLLG